MQEFKRLARRDWSLRLPKTGKLGPSLAAAAFAALLAVWSTPSGYAQGTPAPGTPPTKDDRLLPAPGNLPLPVPGTPPATTPAPETPAVPGAPGEEARARAAAMAAKANIDVTDAWTRATPANGTTANVYLHLVSAKDADRLVGLEVSNAARIDVREPTDQGAAKGNAAPSVDVPAGGTVNFAPGMRYLLLSGLKAPLREGESFLLTLRFDKGGSQTAVVKVLNANASGPPQSTAARSGDTTAGATTR
jgi:periplasmic copper chaperone A